MEQAALPICREPIIRQAGTACRLSALLERRRVDFALWRHGFVGTSPSHALGNGAGTFRIAPASDPLPKLDLTEEPTYSS